MAIDQQTVEPPSRLVGSIILHFISRHGAPIVLAALLWWVLWWGHTPQLETVEDAMWHVSWVGVIALVYVALQARAVLVQPRSGVLHAMIELVVALLPFLVVAFALFDWARGNNPLSVFQVIVMVQAIIATLIDVVIFSWVSMKLNRLSVPLAVAQQ